MQISTRGVPKIIGRVMQKTNYIVVVEWPEFCTPRYQIIRAHDFQDYEFH